MGLGPTVPARSVSHDTERAGVPVSAVELTAEQAWFLADRLGAGGFPWVLAITQPYSDPAAKNGFDADQVDAQFWPGTQVRTNVLCTLGKGDPSKVHPRLPRLAFDEVCRLA